MKKWMRIIAAVLTGTVLMQSVALAEGIPVVIEHVTENGSEVIYEGDISGFNGFTIPWGTDKQDYDFGILFNWDDDDNNSYYTITPGLQETSPLLTDIAKAPVKGDAVNDFSNALIPDLNLEQNIPTGAIQLPAADAAEGIATVDLTEESEPLLAAEPVVINGAQDQSPALFAAGDEIDATSFNTIIAPSAANGVNEPKYSAGQRMAEEISPYSGELTIRTDDLTLAGRNGLDLNIGRIYQSTQANLGQMKYMGVPTNGQGILKTVV